MISTNILRPVQIEVADTFEAVPDATKDSTSLIDQRRAWQFAWATPALVVGVWAILLANSLAPTLSNWPPGASGACGIVAILLLVTASITDIRTLKIRNWTTLPALVFVVGLNFIQTASSSWLGIDAGVFIKGIGVEASLTGALLCFSGMFGLHLLFGGGAGDIKLLTVVGALVGWQVASQIWLAAMFSGAVWALGYTAVRIGRNGCLFLLSLIGQPLFVCRFGGEWAKELLQFQMPMAPHFTIGYVLLMALQLNGHSTIVTSLLAI